MEDGLACFAFHQPSKLGRPKLLSNIFEHLEIAISIQDQELEVLRTAGDKPGCFLIEVLNDATLTSSQIVVTVLEGHL